MDEKILKVKEFIEIYNKCDAFFKDALDKAIQNQRIDISDEASFYIMSLLLSAMKINPHASDKSLAEKYMVAQGKEQSEELKIVGDYSLMIAGIWWQSLLRKSVDVDYYINIGSKSYQKASEVAPKRLGDLFEELSENFVNFTNLLMEATKSISEANMTNHDILRMYEVWLRTHNAFIEQRLRSLGINVVPSKITRQ
jgi:hypothetical protein